MNNLPSMTYQTFEQDPVKYRNYEEARISISIAIFNVVFLSLIQAVYRALSEWPSSDRMYVIHHDSILRF